jgi:hypothetical protein
MDWRQDIPLEWKQLERHSGEGSGEIQAGSHLLRPNRWRIDSKFDLNLDIRFILIVFVIVIDKL